MAKFERDPETSGIVGVLFPKGSLHFLGAVISMIAALALMWLPLSAFFLAGYSVGTSTVVIMAGLVILSLTLTHPTFMLTRGKGWAPPFLRKFNILCIVLLSVSGALHLVQGKADGFYLAIAGLPFALIAFKLYRTNAFAYLCDHYQILWDDYRQRRKLQE